MLNLIGRGRTYNNYNHKTKNFKAIHRGFQIKPKENVYVEMWCCADSVIFSSGLLENHRI